MNSHFLLFILPILVSGVVHGPLTPSEKAENLRTCGITTGISRKIHGGQYAAANQAPWAVRFQQTPRWCSGSLISLRHILVSGRCFERTVVNASRQSFCNGTDKVYPRPIYSIALGLSSGKTRFSPEFGVQKATWLDGCSDQRDYAHDVMILELTTNLLFSPLVCLICVPEDKVYVRPGEAIKVFGFDSNTTMTNASSKRTSADVRQWMFTVTQFTRFHQYTVTSPMVSLTAEDAGNGHVVIRNGRKYLAGMTVTPIAHGALASIVGHYHRRICDLTNAC